MRDWPLVERAAALAEVWGQLTGPVHRGVVLAGPAGVGRTAVGRACMRLAEDEGFETVRVTATRAAAGLPFGAVAPLLPPSPQPTPGDDRAELLGRTVAALAERSRERPLLLFVDDAHLLDDASATLVHHIAASGAAILLAAVRSGEPAPDPVVALWKDGLCARVELEGLDPEATAELLRTVLGGPVDPAAAAHLAERCQGNLVFLRELVAGAVDDGSLREDGGVWRLDGHLTASARLVEVVEAHLGELDDDERALLEVVALGEPIGSGELAALSDPSVAEALERRGLLVSRLEGERLLVHIAPPLVGDVVRARTPAVRARAIVESLAGAVSDGGPVDHDDDILRMATWALTAGGADAQALLEGAGVARDRHDLPQAEALARAAADAGAGFDAALLAARMAARQGRVEEADAALADLAAAAADDGERGRAVLARFDTSVVWSGHDGGALLDTAAALVDDPAWRDRLAARRLALVLLAEGPRAALDAARPLLASGDDQAVAFAELVTADALARAGRIDEALAMAERGEEAAAPDDLTAWSPWWLAVTRTAALVHCGRFAEAEALADDHRARALADGAADAHAVFAVLETAAIADRGRVRSVARRAREAAGVHRRLGRPVLVRRDLAARAIAHALAGDADAAAADLGELDALDLPPMGRDEADLLQARAWAAAAAGDLPGARAHLEDAAAWGEQRGDLVGTAAALHALARLGRAGAVRDRLGAVASRIDGELAPARVAHTEALAGADAAALDAAATRFEELGADLLAAEAAADAAVAHRRGGDRRAAAAAARRASDLATRAEHPVTPALHAIETRAVLTPAERETAVLAASGRANKEIAEQLHLSPRTVENRLQRVYDKLGVSGRAELPEVLVPAG